MYLSENIVLKQVIQEHCTVNIVNSVPFPVHGTNRHIRRIGTGTHASGGIFSPGTSYK
jgi:hypothetical protein